MGIQDETWAKAFKHDYKARNGLWYPSEAESPDYSYNWLKSAMDHMETARKNMANELAKDLFLGRNEG